MMSEWLVEVPEDFEHSWMMIVCPIGRRSLVISSKGTTLAYARSGQCLKQFPSNLPGGCRSTYHTSHDNCILDCIFHEGTRTYYVLDIMCWRGHPVYDSDTEFRSFWLKSKLAEEGEKLSTHSRTNPFKFIQLDSFPCSKDSITQVLGSRWHTEVDGLLFLHKEAHYTTGRSPLAVWLKAHMVPDLLHLPISDEFLACAPTMSEPKASSDSSGSYRARSKVKQSSGEQMDSSDKVNDHESGFSLEEQMALQLDRSTKAKDNVHSSECLEQMDSSAVQ